jgi:hypothetical protein
MILDVPVIADLQLLQQQRQALIDQNLVCANHKRISHDCQPGDKVLLLLTCKPNKLEPRAAGLFTIHAVHASDGTATINCNPHVREQFNTRHVRPCCRQQVPHEGFVLL